MLDLGWKPVGPDYWLEPAPSDLVWQITGIGDLRRFLEAIDSAAMREHWALADPHESGKGLSGNGEAAGPDLKAIKKRLKSYELRGPWSA